jgi:hypothetical protein
MLGVCVLFYSAGILYTDTVDPYRLWIASYIADVPSDRTRSTNIYNRSFFLLMYLYIPFSPSFFFVTVVMAVFLYCRCNKWQILSDVIFLSSWYSHHIISKGRFSRLTRPAVYIEHKCETRPIYVCDRLMSSAFMFDRLLVNEELKWAACCWRDLGAISGLH